MTETHPHEHHCIDALSTVNEYISKADWRVNANANQGYSLGGLILNSAGKISANYRLCEVYPHWIGQLHRDGDMHIHDLDVLWWYCAGWSLRQLLEEGLNGVPNTVESKPPKNLQSAVNQMVNFLGTLQNERAGAQAFSSFDTYLAPFVHKYKTQLATDLELHALTFSSPEKKEAYIDHHTRTYVRQQFQNFLFGLNVPSRRWTQTPFTNITLDRVCPEDLRDKRLMLWWVDAWPYEKSFWELDDEIRLINEVLIDVYLAGDAKGRVFTFPIPTYNITEDFPRDDPLVDKLFEMTAKYGIPYFQNFVWSQYFLERQDDGTVTKVKNPNAYTPGAVRSMCCRLQLDLNELIKRGNGLFWSAEMTWSIWVVTLNLARIWYQCRGHRAEFLARVGYLMDAAYQSLELKRAKLHDRLALGMYPYTKRYLWTYRNHFSTIGINGMHEAIRNFTGDSEGITTERGQTFATEVMHFMREKLTRYQEESWHLYNLEATPAEWTTYRFAKADTKRFDHIITAGTQAAPYYTNSTQVPVEFSDDLFEVLEQQNTLQCLYTGWTVLHLYLWERLPDALACKTLVKKVISTYQLPYITVTPTFSICPKHGYIQGERDYCPKCDQEIGYIGNQRDIDTRQIYTANHKKFATLIESPSSQLVF